MSSRVLDCHNKHTDVQQLNVKIKMNVQKQILGIKANNEQMFGKQE